MSVLANTRIVQIITNKNPYKFVSDDADLGQVHRVHLKNLIVPNTEYNVNTKTNKVNITSADMVGVADLPIGQYNISSFIEALELVLSNASGGSEFTISQNELSKKLTIVKSSGSEFTIGANSSLKRLIGQSTLKTSVGLSLTCDGIPDLSGMRLVILQSFTLGKFCISQSNDPQGVKTNIIGSLPMTAPFGGILKVEEDEATLNSMAFAGYKNVSYFDIELVDEYGHMLELNDTEYLLQFECHISGAQ